MKISDLFIMGIRNLFRRKARTILTVLGVVIGSISIMIMVSIGKGMEQNFERQVMQQGGLTTITIRTWGAIYDDKGNYVDERQQKLNDDLVEKVKQIEHVKAVSPVISKQVYLMTGKYTGWASIIGMDMNSFKDFEFPELMLGQYPTEEDNSVLIFGGNMPYDFSDWSSRSYKPYTVDLEKDKLILKFQDYGVDENKKEFTLPLTNIAKMEVTNGMYDYNSYMDIKYLKEIYKRYANTLKLEDRKKAIKSLDEYQEIMLNVDNINNVLEVQEKLEEIGVLSFSDMQYLAPLQDASKTLQMVLGALGWVSMLASAISIANTMVMSIYERTKEIGIMKVLGCLVKDVRKLFLFEAGTIGLIGGLIGIGVGYGASILINKYGQPIFGALMSGNYMYDMSNTTFSVIPFYLPFMALGISVAVGVLSGYFPARRATKISPIEAMRTEG